VTVEGKEKRGKKKRGGHLTQGGGIAGLGGRREASGGVGGELGHRSCYCVGRRGLQ